MSFRVYNSGNLLVVTNTITWRVEKFPKNECWYEFINTDAPIIYSLYYKNPERSVILDIPYEEFQDEFGIVYGSDVLLQKDLDIMIGSSDISILDSNGQVDAGGRVRVSQMTTQLDIKQINDNQPLFYNREIIGTGTQVYSKALGGVTMSVTSNLDVAICQSKMWANYFSGKSHFGEITFSGMTNETNVIKRAGYFSSNTTTPFNSNKDGLWFESDGTDFRFRIQKNGADILNVVQSDWNLNALSAFDGSKFNVLVFQFLYLGGTAVRFGFIQNGGIAWCHQYTHAGLIASTFIESPNQPIRYEIRSIGGSGSFDQICAQIASEGSVDSVGVHRHVENGAFTATSSGTEYVLMGIKLKSLYRNIEIELRDLAILATTNDNYLWRLWMNPTVGGTFTYNNETNSALQFAAGATVNTITADGTILIASGSGTGNSAIESGLESAIRLGSNIDGVADEIVLSITPLSNNMTVYSTLGVQEYA